MYNIYIYIYLVEGAPAQPAWRAADRAGQGAAAATAAAAAAVYCSMSVYIYICI